MGSNSKRVKPRDEKNKKSKRSINSQIDLEHLEMKTENHENVDDDKVSSKRNYDEGDSETEELPRKKKKKKQQLPNEEGTTSDKKGKKSIRQMKREKFAQRQAEAATVAKDQLKSQCLSYLSQWKHDRQNWKFMKIKQLWLFKNKFTSGLVPDASWPTLLEYFNSAKGNIRNLLLEDANKVIKYMDNWIESQKKNNNDDNDEDPDNAKPDEISYRRARDLIQCLEE